MKTTLSHLICLVLVSGLLLSCEEQGLTSSQKEKDDQLDSNKTAILSMSGKLFSIPSPLQTAILIRESDLSYMNEALSDMRSLDELSGNMSQAIALGIYGTDMAYASLYEDGQAALKYFKAIEKLSDNLGISGAIDATLVSRLGANSANADSLLMLSGSFFRAADEYLKENQRTDVAAYILLGGWLESTLLTAKAAETGAETSLKRMAEQKESIHTLYEVLNSLENSDFAKSEEMKLLSSLNNLYKDVERRYELHEVETDENSKMSRISSSSAYDMSDELRTEITELLGELRKRIIA